MCPKEKEVVETLCVNCCFADFDPVDESGEWGEQCGCAFDIIPRMRRQGAEVVWHEDEEKKLGYCGIIDRVCVYCRPMEGWYNRLADKDKAMEIARAEVTPRLGFVIVSNGETHALRDTLESIGQMEMKPKSVAVQFTFYNVAWFPPTRLLAMFDEYLEPHGIATRLDYILEDNVTDVRAVDLGSRKIKQPYFASFKAGFIVPPTFINEMDTALNDNLERFLLLKPVDNINGMVVQMMVAKQIGGSTDDLIYNKLERVAEKQECQYLIKPVTEIIPSMKSQS